MSPKEMGDPQRYWPFDVLPPTERTELHQQEIEFLESAYREGFAPYAHGSLELGATANERGGLIVVRGRKCWEVILASGEAKVLSAFVDTFPSAADALLEWLRCAEAADILTRLENHLVKMAGSSHAWYLDALPKSRAGR